MPEPVPILNQLYRIITDRLQVPIKQRPAIMAAGGEALTGAFMGGYWRQPDDERRFRMVTRKALRAWCVGLLDVMPPDNPEQAKALRDIVATLDAGGELSRDMVAAFD